MLSETFVIVESESGIVVLGAVVLLLLGVMVGEVAVVVVALGEEDSVDVVVVVVVVIVVVVVVGSFVVEGELILGSGGGAVKALKTFSTWAEIWSGFISVNTQILFMKLKISCFLSILTFS